MAEKVLILLGTKKGVFIAESDDGRRSWSLSGPFCETWPMNHVVGDPATGTIYGAGGNAWFGPAVWRSDDLGETWSHSSEGLAYAEGEEPIVSGWSLGVANGTVYAGVQPAGLFLSADGGQSWEQVKGLSDHPTRPQWNPGGAGLILHSLVIDPDNHDRLWVGISAAGVFHSADGGKTWEPRNKGTRADFMPEDQRYPEFGQCVHCVVKAPGMSDRLYQQNHCGMYRSDDARPAAGRASRPACPRPSASRRRRIRATPTRCTCCRSTATSAAATCRTARRRCGARATAAPPGRRMRNGLPQENVFFGVLRQAMATDRLDPAGVYFGTSSGTLYASADEGESWATVAEHLPTILSVETMVVE